MFTGFNKHTSFLRYGINYGRKSFMIQAPGVNVIKLLFVTDSAKK